MKVNTVTILGNKEITLTNNNEVICANCGSNKTYILVRNGRGSPEWHNYNNGKICRKCYNKLVVAPKYRKKMNDRQKEYRLDYLGTNLFLSFKLPRDICEVCGITKEERKIDRHHYFYCVIMPWAMTMSICTPCHNKTTHIERNELRIKSISSKVSNMSCFNDSGPIEYYCVKCNIFLCKICHKKHHNYNYTCVEIARFNEKELDILVKGVKRKDGKELL